MFVKYFDDALVDMSSFVFCPISKSMVVKTAQPIAYVHNFIYGDFRQLCSKCACTSHQTIDSIFEPDTFEKNTMQKQHYESNK